MPQGLQVQIPAVFHDDLGGYGGQVPADPFGDGAGHGRHGTDPGGQPGLQHVPETIMRHKIYYVNYDGSAGKDCTIFFNGKRMRAYRAGECPDPHRPGTAAGTCFCAAENASVQDMEHDP